MHPEAQPTFPELWQSLQGSQANVPVVAETHQAGLTSSCSLRKALQYRRWELERQVFYQPTCRCGAGDNLGWLTERNKPGTVKRPQTQSYHVTGLKSEIQDSGLPSWLENEQRNLERMGHGGKNCPIHKPLVSVVFPNCARARAARRRPGKSKSWNPEKNTLRVQLFPTWNPSFPLKPQIGSTLWVKAVLGLWNLPKN